MRKQVYEIGVQGYIVNIHIAEFSSEGNPMEPLPESYITVDPPQGLYRAKWTGSEWVEDMTQEEIDELNNVPQPPTAEEKIAMLEAENADLWYQAMISESRIDSTEQEVAGLWYEIMTMGGM